MHLVKTIFAEVKANPTTEAVGLERSSRARFFFFIRVHAPTFAPLRCKPLCHHHTHKCLTGVKVCATGPGRPHDPWEQGVPQRQVLHWTALH